MKIKKNWKLNNSGHELFIFKIPLIATFLIGRYWDFKSQNVLVKS